MKMMMRISILLNVVLLGGLIFVWADGRKASVQTHSPVLAAAPSQTPPLAAPVFAAPPQMDPSPFRWRQLDSTNYHLYVKNLRGIGCPEPSVRAIVTADVEAVYGKLRRQLEQKLADLDKGSLASQLGAFNSQQAIQAELQQLPDTETRLIADLLGLTPAQPAQPKLPPLPEGPAVLPLALQPLDLAALNLDDQQIKTIDDMRQRFMEKIGGADQNPKDPAYLERWNQAQSEADELTKGFIGNSAYQNLQLQAMANTQAQSAGNPQ